MNRKSESRMHGEDESLSDAALPRKPPLVIWGASGHAAVVADIVRLQNQYAIAGFLDDSWQPGGEGGFCESTILGGREALPALLTRGVKTALIAVGDPHSRLLLAELVQACGFRLCSAVHPKAVIAGDVAISAGTVVAAGAVVNPGVRLGLAAIINTLASVDHGCALGDGATVCPGARLGGNVVVGRCAWIGIGATVRERITIGESSVVGAGAVVVRDVPDRSVVFGVPARVVRPVDAPR